MANASLLGFNSAGNIIRIRNRLGTDVTTTEPVSNATISAIGQTLLGTVSGGLVYLGGVAGDSVPASAPAAGNFYVITTAGSSQGKDWTPGDLAIYRNSQWDRVPSNRMINVKDFGAVGDGVADDYNAIQAAFDFAAVLSSGKGIGVFFPPGVYKHSDTIEIARPVVVVGCGMTGDIPEYECWSGTEVRYTGNGTAWHIEGELNGNFVHRVFMRDLAITSTGSALIGLDMVSVSECEFRSVKWGGVNSNGFSQYGIRADNFSMSIFDTCIIQGCTTAWFFDWDLGGVAQVTIHKANVYNCTNGVKLAGGSSINIVRNWFENVKYAVLVDHTTAQNKVQIDNLRIRDNHFNNGGNFSPGTNSRFLKVNATANVQFYMQRVSVTGNAIWTDTTSAPYGIEITIASVLGGNLSMPEWVIAENSFRGPQTAAVYADTDFSPCILCNDIGPVPALLAGSIHSKLEVRGKTAEVAIGEASSGTSMIRIVSAGAGGTSPNYMQIGRDTADAEAVLVICRQGGDSENMNIAALPIYAGLVQAKGSLSVAGITTLEPPGEGGIAYLLVGPQEGGSSVLRIAKRGTSEDPEAINAMEIYTSLLTVKEGGIASETFFELDSGAPAPIGAADKVRIFPRVDVVSGKQQLCVQFATGAVQVLATQP